MATAKIGITTVSASQNQKEVTINAALYRIDALQAGVISLGDTSPPGSPTEGDSYIIGVSATGDWSGKDNNLTYYLNGWNFISPVEGMFIWVNDENEFYRYDGTSWDIFSGGGGGGGGTIDASDVVSGTFADARIAQSNVTQHQTALLTNASMTGSVTISDSGAATNSLYTTNNNASFTGNVWRIDTVRAASSAFDCIETTAASGGDVTLRARGDGVVTADGSFTGGGADYAECMEWSDGNPNGLDGIKQEVGSNRVGYSVVLENNKIRIAKEGEIPIGITSLNYSTLGNDSPLRWSGKYLKDSLGVCVMEEYEVVEWEEAVAVKEAKLAEDDNIKKVIVHEDVKELVSIKAHSYNADQVPNDILVPVEAKRFIFKRRKLNPNYIKDTPYTRRSERKEWHPVGLIGFIPLRKGQPVAPTWSKQADLDENTELWFIK